MQGRTAEYLLGGKSGKFQFCTPLKSLFLHEHELVGRAIWFHPPYSICRETMEFLQRVWLCKPSRTYLLGLVPYLPNTRWFHRLVGEKGFFNLKRLVHAGSPILVGTLAGAFPRTAHKALRTLYIRPDTHLTTQCDLALIECQPLPHSTTPSHGP